MVCIFQRDIVLLGNISVTCLQDKPTSIGQSYNQDDSVTLMGHTYNRGDANIRSTGPTYGSGDGNSISMGDAYSKGEGNIISFGGFPDEQDIIPVDRPLSSSYDLLYNQSSEQISETACEKEPDTSNTNAVLCATQVAKSRPESVSKNKSEFKTSRKEAPNSFPSNVRSLISTGMLDGVPVKYISLAREVNSSFFLYASSDFCSHCT